MDQLSLDPNGQFAEEVSEWKNGATYKINATIRQTAPGKYEVVEMTEAGEAQEPGETETPAPAPAAGGKKGMMEGTHAPIAVLMVGKK